MARLIPILFILAALIVAVIVLFGDPTEDGGSALDVEDDLLEDGPAPGLRHAEGVRRPKKDAAKADPAKDAEPEMGPRGRARFIHGTVLDDSTGKPIAGAALQAELAGICPRLPRGLRQTSLGTARPSGVPFGTNAQPRGHMLRSTSTDAQGRFDWQVGDVRILADGFDIFVSAPGYIPGTICQPSVGDEVTVRLKRALKLKIEVRDHKNRAVVGAAVLARPAPETPHVPGFAAAATTDERGEATLDGLAHGNLQDGEIVLLVDHPQHMPHKTDPIVMGRNTHVDVITLMPALRLSLRIRSDDASGIKNPTLQWTIGGREPKTDLVLLKVKPNGPTGEPTSELLAEAVRIPCARRDVDLEVKGEGFAPWKQTEPVPADGGEREVIAILTRDTSLGALELRFQGPDGSPVPYRDLGSSPPEITPLDGQDLSSVTMQGGEALTLPSLPAGRYRIAKRSPKYAPVELDIDVQAGEPTTHTAKLAAAAKLRIRFTASAPYKVRFRLERNGHRIPAFRASAEDEGPGPSSDAPQAATGGDGTVFTGLPAGAVTIVVTSPELTAARKTVQLQEGATGEVQIEVREK